MANHVIHVATANSHYRRATCLALQGCKAKGFLNTGMNKKISCTIKASQLARVGAVANPRKILSSQLQLADLRSVGSIANNKQMKFIRPASLQGFERAKQSRCVFLFREPAHIKQKTPI